MSYLSPVCLCRNAHGPKRHEQFNTGIVALIALPIDSGASEQLFQLLIDWSKRVDNGDVGNIGSEDGGSIAH